jgi:DNA-binding LytR/AlgR family response regulator
MRIFVLEDSSERVRYFIERYAEHEITITENANDAISYLSENVYDCIFLDHDLGDGNGSGADVAAFLGSGMSVNDDAVIIIHSWNMPASAAMLRMLPGAFLLPYGSSEFHGVDVCNRGS